VAVEQGAGRVTVLYRRTQEEMPGWKREFATANRLGVEFRWLTDVLEVEGYGQQVCSVKTIHMQRLEEVDSSGRRRVEPVPGTFERIPCETLIVAIGQSLDFADASLAGLKLVDGRLWVDENSMQTSVPRIFAGGDAVRGGSYVVQAAADGMRAAEGIFKSIFGEGNR
jgi:NADPH-dependent glutamate synthase beta subunit-like oxidoreductase